MILTDPVLGIITSPTSGILTAPTGTGACCYKQAYLCSDDSPGGLWMKSSDITGNVYKVNDICYYFDGVLSPCPGTIIGAGGTWHADCSACCPCVTCPPISVEVTIVDNVPGGCVRYGVPPAPAGLLHDVEQTVGFNGTFTVPKHPGAGFPRYVSTHGCHYDLEELGGPVSIWHDRDSNCGAGPNGPNYFDDPNHPFETTHRRIELWTDQFNQTMLRCSILGYRFIFGGWQQYCMSRQFQAAPTTGSFTCPDVTSMTFHDTNAVGQHPGTGEYHNAAGGAAVVTWDWCP